MAERRWGVRVYAPGERGTFRWYRSPEARDAALRALRRDTKNGKLVVTVERPTREPR